MKKRALIAEESVPPCSSQAPPLGSRSRPRATTATRPIRAPAGGTRRPRLPSGHPRRDGQLGRARLGERRHVGGRGDQDQRRHGRRPARPELPARGHRGRLREQRRPERVRVGIRPTRPGPGCAAVTTPCAASSAFWRLDAAVCRTRNCSGVIFLFRFASAISSSSGRVDFGYAATGLPALENTTQWVSPASITIRSRRR